MKKIDGIRQPKKPIKPDSTQQIKQSKLTVRPLFTTQAPSRLSATDKTDKPQRLKKPAKPKPLRHIHQPKPTIKTLFAARTPTHLSARQTNQTNKTKYPPQRPKNKKPVKQKLPRRHIHQPKLGLKALSIPRLSRPFSLRKLTPLRLSRPGLINRQQVFLGIFFSVILAIVILLNPSTNTTSTGNPSDTEVTAPNEPSDDTINAVAINNNTDFDSGSPIPLKEKVKTNLGILWPFHHTTNKKEEQPNIINLSFNLQMIINGQRQFIPGNYRFADNRFIVKANSANGDLHVQALQQEELYTLHDFFAGWGGQFNQHCLLKHCLLNGQTITMTVNGTINNQFGDYAIQPSDKIVITLK